MVPVAVWLHLEDRTGKLNPEPVNLVRLINDVIGTAGQLAEP